MFFPTRLSAGYYSADATAAEAAAREARTDVELLKHDVNRLLMISEALWVLLKREHGYTDDVLTDLIGKIDLRDGKLDGQGVKDPPRECPSCHKINSATRPFCIYCGKPLQANLFSR